LEKKQKLWHKASVDPKVLEKENEIFIEKLNIFLDALQYLNEVHFITILEKI